MNCHIWNSERRGWWDCEGGYTGNRQYAKSFSKHEATALCDESNRFLSCPNHVVVPILDGANGPETLMRELTDARSELLKKDSYIANLVGEITDVKAHRDELLADDTKKIGELAATIDVLRADLKRTSENCAATDTRRHIAQERVASLEAFIAGSKESTAVQQAVIVQGLLGFDASVRPEQVHAAVTELLEGRKRDAEQVELLMRLKDEAVHERDALARLGGVFEIVDCAHKQVAQADSQRDEVLRDLRLTRDMLDAVTFERDAAQKTRVAAMDAAREAANERDAYKTEMEIAHKKYDEALATVKYWIEQHGVEAEKRGAVEHLLDQAMGDKSGLLDDLLRDKETAVAYAEKWRGEYDVKVEQLLSTKQDLIAARKNLYAQGETMRALGKYAETLRNGIGILDYNSDGIPTTYPTRAYCDELLGLKPVVESVSAQPEPLILTGQGSPFCGSGDPTGSQNAQDAVLAREGRLTVVRPGSHRHRVLAGFLARPEGLRQIDAGQIALEQYSVGANTESGANTGRRRCTDLATMGLIRPTTDSHETAKWEITPVGIAAMELLDKGEAFRLKDTVTP